MAVPTVGVFDIETDGVDHWGRNRSEFFRIGGISVNGKDPVIYDARYAFEPRLRDMDVLIGHNILAFDLPAIYGADTPGVRLAKARRLVDTWSLAPLADPAPYSYTTAAGAERVIADKPERMMPFYKLDNLAHRYGFPGKVGDLKALAKEFGGFGKIPKDDPRYREYLDGDVRASGHLARHLAGALDDYAWREQVVSAITAQVHCNGFRLDVELAQAVVDAHAERNNATLARLAERYGVPLTLPNGKPRKKPLASKEGKAALEAAFRDLLPSWVEQVDGYPPGVVTEVTRDLFDAVWPRTPKGAFAWGGEAIQEAVAEHVPDNLEARELARVVAEIGGTRTVFQNALDNVHPDGFCHPQITVLQRTGRTSVTDPGLTVFGKHNGRHLERGIFLPDVLPGEAHEPDTHVLFAVDLAQMDNRIVAALAQDHAYLDLFEPGRDAHTMVAEMIWGPKSGWGAHDRRQDAKSCSHGTNYGMGWDKLAREAGVPPETAQHFQEQFRVMFPRLEAWKHEVREHGRMYGWVGNGFGRKIKVDPDRVFTQGPAGAGQGGTRDMLFQGAIDIDDVDPRVTRMIKGFVHDEMVFSVARRDALEVRDLVVRTMSRMWAPPGVSRPVPVIAEASPFADRWSGCYEKH